MPQISPAMVQAMVDEALFEKRTDEQIKSALLWLNRAELAIIIGIWTFNGVLLAYAFWAGKF